MFRLPPAITSAPSCAPLPLAVVRQVIDEVLAPGHFYLRPGTTLVSVHRDQESLAWEIFRGRLLDPRHTREERTFETWNLFLETADGRTEAPLLALLLDPSRRQLHVVRGILSYVWEGYDSGGGVFLSRETTRWVRELTATLALDQWSETEALRRELSGCLFRAVVGASRLPLTSLEAPLPGFSLGEIHYCHEARAGATPHPMRSWEELVERSTTRVTRSEQARVLEMILHVIPEEALAEFVERWEQSPAREATLLQVLRTLYNEVSLSPWTDLVSKTLLLLQTLEAKGHPPAESVDFLGYLLRQMGRHLTAYDLVLFHHRGANYPDALLLDAVLHALLDRVLTHPELFLSGEERAVRRRRRALRQGWFLRRFYEGHPVPEVPTSPGESMRVFPGQPRVPEEQIMQSTKRPRQLYVNDSPLSLDHPALAQVWSACLRDLDHPEELRELGCALFLDRPLGVAKEPGEPDQTLLLSHLAFSASVAGQRLQKLATWGALAPGDVERLQANLRTLAPPSLPLSAVQTRMRPGTVSLLDARQVADDFCLLRTTRQTVQELWRAYHFEELWRRHSLDELRPARDVVIVPGSDPATGKPLLTIHDAQMRPRVELQLLLEDGYVRQDGVEYLAGGFLVRRVIEG